jgi:hypothetical protein
MTRLEEKTMTQTQISHIQAAGIYGLGRKPYGKSDPPEGCVQVCRYHSGGRQYKIGQPWPALSVGQEIEIDTTDHYIWIGTVEAIIDEDTIHFRPSAPKVPMPLPPVIEGQPYLLPYMVGDAWSVAPEAGKVLLIEDQPYKVIGKPKCDRRTGKYIFVLRPVAASEYATRPGRIAIRDYTATDPRDTTRYYRHNVGRIVKIGMEFLHITDVERVSYGSGEGDEIFGYNTIGVGRFVGAEKAAKLDEKWKRADKIRSLELSLKVAGQDFDYGGNPDAIPGIKAEIERLRAQQ